MIYEQEYNIRYNEMDYNMVLKPSALLNFLQDMAQVNAEMLGFGYTFVSEHNYAWFLLKYRMEFDDYPKGAYNFKIKTEARGMSKIMAYRDFDIISEDNKRFGRVASTWAMVDLSNKNMLNVQKVVDFMPPYEKRDDDLHYNKIKPLSRVDFEHTFDVRFDDIDVNRHVNNANYIIWAFEALPYEFKSQYKLKTLDMVYKKEIAFGHKVLSQVEFDEENLTSTHVVKNKDTGDDLCFVHAEFTKL